MTRKQIERLIALSRENLEEVGKAIVGLKFGSALTSYREERIASAERLYDEIAETLARLEDELKRATD